LNFVSLQQVLQKDGSLNANCDFVRL